MSSFINNSNRAIFISGGQNCNTGPNGSGVWMFPNNYESDLSNEGFNDKAQAVCIDTQPFTCDRFISLTAPHTLSTNWGNGQLLAEINRIC